MTSHRKAVNSAGQLPSQFPGKDIWILKKWTYKIFRNVGQLGHLNKAITLYSIRHGDDLYINLCLKHMRDYLACALGSIQNPSLRMSVANYLDELDKLISRVKDSSEQNREIERSLIPRFLQYHTRVFNILIDKDIEVTTCPDEWLNASQTSIRIWGDKAG